MNRSRRIGLGSVAFGVMLGVGACASKQTTAGAAAMNSTCPYSGQAVSASAPTREYNGQTVGFCCEQCPQNWDKASDADKTAMYDKMAMAR